MPQEIHTVSERATREFFEKNGIDLSGKDLPKGERIAWCGSKLLVEFYFADAAHLFNTLASGSLVGGGPCKNCMKVLADLLAAELP